ncbi:YbbR-like domain-containing protein [Psychroserpens sp. SPM9]|uniref:YbbR-like domain-containing protein n=1 Tax=Psychroserpens sp. SPM9 TaxID=2975598 RepID=UPI0021A2E361|nr:YbbR-like domain-containing protein [Psychroserpens sp. SPM9]MDG5491719.1 YbbR-like domain-containing protein [Psychroserpens sp. SPM9]
MLNSIKSKLLKSVKNKRLNVFGLFFLIAFLILVVTKLSETYVETIPFNIAYNNLPDTNIITLDSTPKVNVTVSTHGFNLLSYYFYSNTYKLDIENHTTQKENTYLWTADKGLYSLQEQLGKTVKIVSVKPDTLVLPFGILSTKTVPVVLKSKIHYASGYDTTNGVKIIPDSVKIIGSQQEISKIDFIETKPFDLNQIKTDISTTIGLELANKSERLKLSEDKVQINANVEKFTEGTFEIPITILNKPNAMELNYFPKHIKVAYYVSLEAYNDIKVTDFKIECDYKEALQLNNSFFTPQLISLSEQVKSAKMKQNKVEFIIVK